MALITRLNNSIIVIVRMIFGSSFFFVASVGKRVRDRETKRQSEVSAEIFFVRHVAMSHCPIVSLSLKTYKLNFLLEGVRLGLDKEKVWMGHT